MSNDITLSTLVLVRWEQTVVRQKTFTIRELSAATGETPEDIAANLATLTQTQDWCNEYLTEPGHPAADGIRSAMAAAPAEQIPDEFGAWRVI